MHGLQVAPFNRTVEGRFGVDRLGIDDGPMLEEHAHGRVVTGQRSHVQRRDAFARSGIDPRESLVQEQRYDLRMAAMSSDVQRGGAFRDPGVDCERHGRLEERPDDLC